MPNQCARQGVLKMNFMDIFDIQSNVRVCDIINLSFSFGALCPKFSEQLKDQGYELKNKEKWDKAVFSVVYLHIHDILTDSRYDECLNRIMKKSKVDWIKSEV